MVANKRRDTVPELLIRRRLHAEGFRYRVDFPVWGDRRRADIAFTRHKVAVFVDGCFWHGCPQHFVLPKANRQFWRSKIKRNTERDRQAVADLEALGWKAARVWEHVPLDEAMSIIRGTLLGESEL